MKTKADIKAIARTIWRLHHGRTLKTPSIMHPEREWATGLLLSLLSVVLVGAWSGYRYVENRSIITNGVEIEAPEQVFYTPTPVEEALDLLTTREARRNAILGTVESIPEASELSTTTATGTEAVSLEGESEVADEALEPLIPEDTNTPTEPPIFDGPVQLEF